MAKTDHTKLNDAGLEALFRAARAETPAPSGDLMARIVADAEAEIAARARPLAGAGRPRPGLWAALIGAIGGWPALASMATAAVAGVWLGFASPDQLNTIAGGVLLPDSATTDTSYELEDILPGYSGFASLGEEGQG